MPYRFKAGRSLTHEVRRIASRQLELAIGELRTVGDRRADQSVHEARRHVKKVRALLRLVRPALGDRYTASNRRLRRASRLLGGIADGEAVVDAVTVLRGGRVHVPARTIGALHAELVAREADIDRKARSDRVLPKAAAILRREHAAVGSLALNAHGFAAITGGLHKSIGRMRRAAIRAGSASTAANFHRWRRRAKDVWLQVRLLDGRCGGRLNAVERRLELLDGLLGDYHNVVLLERILIGDALLPRRQTAICLRALRHRQLHLRRRTAAVAAPLVREKPGRFVRRVKRLWRPAARRGATEARWPHAA